MSEEAATEATEQPQEATNTLDSSTGGAGTPDTAPEAVPDLLGGDNASQEQNTNNTPDLLQTGQQFSYEQPRGMNLEGQQRDEMSAFATALAQGAGITDQAQAQGLYEALARNAQEYQQNLQQEIAAMREGYATELEREVGKAKADELRENANSYLHRNGGSGLAQVLTDNNLGHHPEVLKFFAAQAGAPEPNTGGSSSVAAPKTLAEAMQSDEAGWKAWQASQRK